MNVTAIMLNNKGTPKKDGTLQGCRHLCLAIKCRNSYHSVHIIAIQHNIDSSCFMFDVLAIPSQGVAKIFCGFHALLVQLTKRSSKFTAFSA